VDDAVFIGGWWLPATDLQARRTAGKVSTVRPVVQGRTAWQYSKIMEAAMLPKTHKTAIDIGAHIGWWSCWLVQKFEKVVAFEPVPLQYDLLRKNVTRSNFDAVNCALGFERGQVWFDVEEVNTHRAFITDGGSQVTAELRRLDDFSFVDVSFIKIDVEGYEKRVLLGGEETIRRDKPVIVIEQLGHEERYSEERDSATTLLKEWGAVELIPQQKGDYFMGWV